MGLQSVEHTTVLLAPGSLLLASSVDFLMILLLKSGEFSWWGDALPLSLQEIPPRYLVGTNGLGSFPFVPLHLSVFLGLPSLRSFEGPAVVEYSVVYSFHEGECEMDFWNLSYDSWLLKFCGVNETIFHN